MLYTKCCAVTSLTLQQALQISGQSVSQKRTHKHEKHPCCVFRSVPRGRKQTVDKMLKSPGQTKIPPQQTSASSERADDMVSLLESKQELNSNTPHSKTANKLAALQMCSPGCTPSPMPRRRRLQQDQPWLQGNAPQTRCEASMDECEVICID